MNGWNKSGRAFSDVHEVLERALSAPKGIRIPCSSRSAAITLRARSNYYRKLDRVRNRETYPEKDHPMHGASVYDSLVLRIPPKGTPEETTLYIEPRSIEDFNIEEIT